MTRTWKKWAPAAVAAGALGAAALIVPITANAAVDLPDRTAEEVLDLVGNKNVNAFSGTIEQTSDLGLPDLSALDAAGGTNDSGEPSPAGAAIELLTGSSTAQVFVDGPEQARLQILDHFDERNIIRNGADLWYYNSETNEAVHTTAGDHEAHHTKYDAATSSPPDVAALFLERIDPSTEVTVGSDRMVAGRAVYNLILTPRSDETLVGAVNIAVDGETGLPLGVTVTANGTGTPAFSSSFTAISYEAPDPSVFAFTPPEGATVTELNKGAIPKGGDRPEGAPAQKPTVVGEGWDAVVVVPNGGQEIPETLDQLSVPVDGGRLLETTLVNVLLTDDGRILAGSVTPERLQAVAAGQ